MNYNYLTTIFRSTLTQICVFLVLFTIFHFDLEKFISKNCKYIFFYQNFEHLGENTCKYCSRIIIVHVHATVFFSKVHRACHKIANCIKPGSVFKKIEKHAADCSIAVCWGVVIYIRYINCSYNNVAKAIRLLDKKNIFVYTGKMSCKNEL